MLHAPPVGDNLPPPPASWMSRIYNVLCAHTCACVTAVRIRFHAVFTDPFSVMCALLGVVQVQVLYLMWEVSRLQGVVERLSGESTGASFLISVDNGLLALLVLSAVPFALLSGGVTKVIAGGIA